MIISVTQFYYNLWFFSPLNSLSVVFLSPCENDGENCMLFSNFSFLRIIGLSNLFYIIFFFHFSRCYVALPVIFFFSPSSEHIYLHYLLHKFICSLYILTSMEIIHPVAFFSSSFHIFSSFFPFPSPSTNFFFPSLLTILM